MEEEELGKQGKKNKEGVKRSERDTDGGSGRKGHRPLCVQSS